MDMNQGNLRCCCTMTIPSLFFLLFICLSKLAATKRDLPREDNCIAKRQKVEPSVFDIIPDDIMGLIFEQALDIDPLTIATLNCVNKRFKSLIGSWCLNLATTKFVSDSNQAKIVGGYALEMVKPLEMSDMMVSTYAKLMANTGVYDTSVALIESFMLKNPSETQDDAFLRETFQALGAHELCTAGINVKDRIHLMREFGDTKTFMPTIILKSDDSWRLYSAYVDAVLDDWTAEPEKVKPLQKHYQRMITSFTELWQTKVNQIRSAFYLCCGRERFEELQNDIQLLTGTEINIPYVNDIFKGATQDEACAQSYLLGLLQTGLNLQFYDNLDGIEQRWARTPVGACGIFQLIADKITECYTVDPEKAFSIATWSPALREYIEDFLRLDAENEGIPLLLQQFLAATDTETILFLTGCYYDPADFIQALMIHLEQCHNEGKHLFEVLSLQKLLIVMEMQESDCPRFAIIEAMFYEELMNALGANPNAENTEKLKEFATAQQGVFFFMELLGTVLRKYPKLAQPTMRTQMARVFPTIKDFIDSCNK